MPIEDLKDDATYEETMTWADQVRALSEEGQRQVEQMTYLMEKYPTQDLLHDAFFHDLAPDDFKGMTQKQFDQINGMYEKTGRVGKGVRPEDEGDTGDTGDPGDTGYVPEEPFDYDKIDKYEISNLMAAQAAVWNQQRERAEGKYPKASRSGVIAGPPPPKPEYGKYRPGPHTETGQTADPTKAEREAKLTKQIAEHDKAKKVERGLRAIGME